MLQLCNTENAGFKSTDRQGTKGVIGKIIPDADIPIAVRKTIGIFD